jgi:hypothetical protein
MKIFIGIMLLLFNLSLFASNDSICNDPTLRGLLNVRAIGNSSSGALSSLSRQTRLQFEGQLDERFEDFGELSPQLLSRSKAALANFENKTGESLLGEGAATCLPAFGAESFADVTALVAITDRANNPKEALETMANGYAELWGMDRARAKERICLLAKGQCKIFSPAIAKHCI